MALADGCRKLQTFICKGCIAVTDEGVGAIAQNAHDLRALNLHSCSVSIIPRFPAFSFIIFPPGKDRFTVTGAGTTTFALNGLIYDQILPRSCREVDISSPCAGIELCISDITILYTIAK